MPRKPKAPAPKVEEEEEDGTIGGSPEHGEEHPGDEGGEPEPPVREPAPTPAPQADPEKAAMQSRIDALQRDVDTLRRSTPPATPKEPTAKPDEVDWEKLMFENPKEYTRLLKLQVQQETEAKLTAQYQRDQGTQAFWSNFYAANTDLTRKDDHVLVEALLNANMSELANIPVADAMKKLADLTRERILHYAGGEKKTIKRPKVEGAEPPIARRAAPEDDGKVTTLSDIIRARRTNRSKASAA